MRSKFRIRFAADGVNLFVSETARSQTAPKSDYPNRRRKSKFACEECKRRHLKCDEAFPVCKRCQRRGSECHSAFRATQWQLELPGVTINNRSNLSTYADNRLLQYWFEKASQLMVIDPNDNPFSFGILKYLESTQSLVCTIQSLSIAHEKFFSTTALANVLPNQGLALKLVRQELQDQNEPPHGSLLTVLLLGLGSAWVHHQDGNEFGKEHLHGARAILDILLANPESDEDPLVRMAVAIYLGWDQATSFVLSTTDQIPLYSADLWRCIQTMRSEYNATVGYAVEIMYCLGNVGRYCRMLVDGGPRLYDVEEHLLGGLSETRLVGNDLSSLIVNDTFQKHGLIMLYRSILSHPDTGPEESYLEAAVQGYAKQILENISLLPEDDNYHRILTLPLFTAGAELMKEDATEREQVRDRFRRLFSLNRLPANLHAIEMLEELWHRSDEGCGMFWLSHSLEKCWFFMLC